MSKSLKTTPTETLESQIEILKPSIDTVIAKHGISVVDFVKCLARGLKAKKVRYDKDGEEVSEEEDLNVQHKFFVSGMELLGYMKGMGANAPVVDEGKKEAESAYKRWRTNGTTGQN